MKVFSYNDYIKAIHTLRLNEVFRVAEESEKYEIEKKTKEEDNLEKELMKTILENKVEVEKIINVFLNPNEKIKQEDLIKYNNSYIYKKYKGKEPDIIYKLKNNETYFIIEYLQNIDTTIPYRMLNCCIDIIYEWTKKVRQKSEINYPIIVPIVIYTGKEKWKSNKSAKEKGIGEKVLENYNVNIEYNLIETNKLTEVFLLKQKSIFRL